MSSKLFEPGFLGKLTIKNRFVRSATWEGMAGEDGSCTPGLVDVVSELAQGEVGLIVSSHVFVSPEGQAGPWQLGAHEDRFIPGLARMADVAHQHGSVIVMQLAHAGLHAATALTKTEALCPSSLPRDDGAPCRELTRTDIDRIMDAFVAAATRARAAGFDGVQIHAAHGYLLSQFLSPYFNRRQDEFGGSIANRARIVLRILERIKSTLGADFPVLIKMNSDDFIDGGLTVEDMLLTSGLLEATGIDAVELSGGTLDAASHLQPIRQGPAPSSEDEVFYHRAALRFKQSLAVPLILVGGIRSYEVADRLISEGITDFIALSRPLIREPRLVARWKGGDTQSSACRSCNQCFKPLLEGQGMCCVSRERELAKKSGH
jgi:2,4-dienoyl-CoA reductase-like NADH-dependent reductase (Old Yellow Enzyme family)